MASATSAPAFYRFFFKNLDPLVAMYGVYLNFFAQEMAVTGPAPNSHYDPDQVFLFFQCGGLALAIAFITAAVHRSTEDLKVWRAVQFALLLADIAALVGIYLSLSTQNRLAPSAWTDDDKGLLGSYIPLTLIRLAFILNVGFPQEQSILGEKQKV
ncbi:unnamed protein product [Clonostachys rhizophaga]|uniref:DUF7704 domain-containing protein n=1 Tax=Clonostachys rhizophaga TaxID=160324 RepID=A0A9N9YNB4_9HYPO|nr:unnamed protein product [Clonostachys rhizophaga]